MITALEDGLKDLIERSIVLKIASSISLFVGNAHRFLELHAGEGSKERLYDLASLTKILGTAPALACAVLEGKASFDEKPFLSWPKISVRDLLSHRSGLAAHRHFYELPGISERDFGLNKKMIYKALLKEVPEAALGQKYIYSDLNFILLARLLEERYRLPLFEIFQRSYKKMALNLSFEYFPSGKKFVPQDIAHVAETAHSKRQKTVMRAQVHDDNCYYLGGISGHAGLFGSLGDVVTMGSYFLRCAQDPQNAYEKSINYMIKHGLAFDRRNPRGSVRALSPHAFGHFGFTGTSLWLDPADNLCVTLLTNRVATQKQSEGIFWLREKVHRLAKLL
jgi:CubicO group peptidase (beta-lactamase class C family)